MTIEFWDKRVRSVILKAILYIGTYIVPSLSSSRFPRQFVANDEESGNYEISPHVHFVVGCERKLDGRNTNVAVPSSSVIIH